MGCLFSLIVCNISLQVGEVEFQLFLRAVYGRLEFFFSFLLSPFQGRMKSEESEIKWKVILLAAYGFLLF